MGCTAIKFADGTKWKETRAVTQGDLDRDELTGTFRNSARTNTKSCRREGRRSCSGTGWVLPIWKPPGAASWAQAHSVPGQQRWTRASQASLAGAWPANREGIITPLFRDHQVISERLHPVLHPHLHAQTLINWGQFSVGPPAWWGWSPVRRGWGCWAAPAWRTGAFRGHNGFPVPTGRLSRTWSQALHSDTWYAFCHEHN